MHMLMTEKYCAKFSIGFSDKYKDSAVDCHWWLKY
jgi:hypothetical protein